MLDLMRRHARSWLIKVALGGIIIVFIFWYGWSGPTERTAPYAAKVNDTIISYDEYRTVYDSEVEKIRLRFRGESPHDLIEKLKLPTRIVEAMVDQRLMIQEAARLGMFVTDQDLVKDIQSNPAFQRDGRFDPQMYRMYLSSVKLVPSVYEETRKRELLQMQVVGLLTDGVKTNPEEIKRLWHFQNDKLNLSYLLIKPEEEKTSADPKEVESYFKKNQAQYQIPASVDVKYVLFSWRDLVKDLSVPDEEARDYYNNNPKEFLVPERVRAKHILLKIPDRSNKEKVDEIKKNIEAIAEKIKAGEKFEDIAQAESQDEATKDKGGELGFFSRGTMASELEKAAFGTEVGKVSDPVLTDQGYELVLVEEKTPEKQLDFSLSKEKIVDKLLEQKARKKVEREADDFYEQVYRTEDLDAQAKKFGLQIRKADSVSRSGSLPEAGGDPKVMEEIFQLNTGGISKLIKSGDNNIVAELVKKNPDRVPELDEVRSTVEKDYLKEKALQIAEKKARDVIEKLNKQIGEADAITQQLGLAWEKTDPVSRTAGFVSQLGNTPEVREMLTTVTTAAPLYQNPIVVTQGVAVVRLTGIERASDEQYEKEAPVFERWVLEVRKTDFLKGWVKKLRDTAKIEINPKLL